MKLAVILLTLATMTNASASQIGCETSVSISVAQALHNNPKTNEVVDADSITLDKSYESVSVYKVTSSSPADQIGIPSRTEWIVITTAGPMATCSVENVLEDSHVE